ncbi:MarR family transcriptional regulator, partial [Streptomyces goshikiensis]
VEVPRRIAAATGFELTEIRDLQTRLNKLTAALDAAAPEA